MSTIEIKAGQRVRVHQTIDRREGDWVRTFDATVIGFITEKTGSWNAHGKDDKLWLNRVHLKKDNGEETIITVDTRTRIELL